MIYLVYMETLPISFGEPKTSINWPIGWIERSRYRDAAREAPFIFKAGSSQRTSVVKTSRRLIKRVTKRQLTAVRKGRDASFLSCYQAMVRALKSDKVSVNSHGDGGRVNPNKPVNSNNAGAMLELPFEKKLASPTSADSVSPIMVQGQNL